MACFTKTKPPDLRPRCGAENSRRQRCEFRAKGYREGVPACGGHLKSKRFKAWRN
jgi:hypothetical protein